LAYSFYRGTDCCAIVFDITRKESFEHLKTWIKGLLDNAAPSDPENFPFIVMGNKSDKEDERQVTTA
jgi:Ras-related protein Rab-7A